jgi:hypothetical protein
MSKTNLLGQFGLPGTLGFQWTSTEPEEIRIETREWLKVLTPGAPTPFMNSILRTDLTEENVEPHIRKAIQEYILALRAADKNDYEPLKTFVRT